MTHRRVSTPARGDLREIAASLRERSPGAANSALRRLRRAVAEIAAHPGVGHRRDDILGASDLRVFAVAPWLIVYRPGRDVVEVVRIIHAARDLGAALRGEDPSED